MRRVVLDASAFLAWFSSGPGQSVRADYQAGALRVHVPSSFTADTLEAAHARHALGRDALERLGRELDRIGFVVDDAPAGELAAWLGRGCDARRAAYGALASAHEIPLLSEDEQTLRVASSVALDPKRW